MHLKTAMIVTWRIQKGEQHSHDQTYPVSKEVGLLLKRTDMPMIIYSREENDSRTKIEGNRKPGF